MKRKLNFLSIFALMAMAFAFVLVSCQKDEMSDLMDVSTEGMYISLDDNNADCKPTVTVDLIAGQDIIVGTVTVTTNTDTEEICVTYAVEDDWLIYETHLYVGATDDFPLTNKNDRLGPPYYANPVPGQFPYGDDELEGEEDWTFCVSFEELGVDCYDWIYIAAHAVVRKTVVDTFTPELTWSRNSEPDGGIVVADLGGTWDREEGFAIETPNQFVWDGGKDGQYFTGYSTRDDISWASWVCTQPGTPSTTGTDLRRFNATFDLPEGYAVTGGKLSSVNDGYEGIIPINDNIYIFVNGELLFWGGTLSKFDGTPTHFLDMERREVENQWSLPIPETDGWYMLGDLPVIPKDLFVEGENELVIFAEEFWTGGGMHELELVLEVEITTGQTAWGNGDRFNERGNWGMWFTYQICCVDENGNGDCRTETAFGGDTRGTPENPWYYYFNTQGEMVQKVYAGQNEEIGTIKIDGQNFNINLTGVWQLREGNETVKVGGYNDPPTARPNYGIGTGDRDFLIHLGNELEFTVDNTYPYYIIHLDVQLCPEP